MKTNCERFVFDGLGAYRILVQGHLVAHWADTFEGMTICASDEKQKPPTTTLTGIVIDQAALLGILTELYDMHCTLLEVKRLPEAAASHATSERKGDQNEI